MEVINIIFGVFSAIIILCIIILIRNHKVYIFYNKLLEEESKYCSQRIYNGKGFDGFKRQNTLPQFKMIFEFWKPLSSYIKPLDDYYKEK